MGLLASFAGLVIGEIAKPILKKIFGRGKRKKRCSSRR